MVSSPGLTQVRGVAANGVQYVLDRIWMRKEVALCLVFCFSGLKLIHGSRKNRVQGSGLAYGQCLSSERVTLGRDDGVAEY